MVGSPTVARLPRELSADTVQILAVVAQGYRVGVILAEAALL